MNQLNGINIYESPFSKAGTAIKTTMGIYLHPLDMLRVTQPELGPVERVMVLVDRNINKALTRINAHT